MSRLIHSPSRARISFAEIEREKQASRDADERALAEGRLSPEQLDRKNSLFHGQRWSVDYRSAKRLW